MKIISFLFSLLLFLAYLFNHRDKREEETQQQQILIDVTEEEKTHIEDFYSEKLKTLNKMLLSARKEEEREENRLKHINTLNQYGIVVNDKNVKRAESDLYRAMKKRLSIENQIYLTEKTKEREGKE